MVDLVCGGLSTLDWRGNFLSVVVLDVKIRQLQVNKRIVAGLLQPDEKVRPDSTPVDRGAAGGSGAAAVWNSLVTASRQQYVLCKHRVLSRTAQETQEINTHS